MVPRGLRAHDCVWGTSKGMVEPDRGRGPPSFTGSARAVECLLIAPRFQQTACDTRLPLRTAGPGVLRGRLGSLPKACPEGSSFRVPMQNHCTAGSRPKPHGTLEAESSDRASRRTPSSQEGGGVAEGTGFPRWQDVSRPSERPRRDCSGRTVSGASETCRPCHLAAKPASGLCSERAPRGGRGGRAGGARAKGKPRGPGELPPPARGCRLPTKRTPLTRRAFGSAEREGPAVCV